MTTPSDLRLMRAIAERAATFYQRTFSIDVKPEFIISELDMVHTEIIRLRLLDLLHADDSNFMHDITGIHRHLNYRHGRFDDCFLPRFAIAESYAGKK